MKHVLLFICLIYAIRVSGQVDIGDIRIFNEYAVTLMFPADIEFVIWGNNPVKSQTEKGAVYTNYEMFQNARTLIIKAIKTGLDKTNISVKTIDGTIYYGFVHNEKSEKIFYNFSGSINEVKPEITQSSVMAKVQDATNNSVIDRTDKDSAHEKKLMRLMDEPVEYKDFGLVANNLIFMVTNIMNDKEHTYLKIIINNKSGNAFTINSVIFKYIEGKTKGIKKRVVANEERTSPVYSKAVDMVEAYSRVDLGYVLPLYSTGSEGRFLIQFIEEKGTRNYQIEISAKDMGKIKNFN